MIKRDDAYCLPAQNTDAGHDVSPPPLAEPSHVSSNDGWRTARRWSGPGPVKLSILMPAFNEARTIRHAVEAVMAVELPCPAELIVIDDGSQDGTASILSDLAGPGVRVVTHPRNWGKGAALLSGAAVATGTHV